MGRNTWNLWKGAYEGPGTPSSSTTSANKKAQVRSLTWRPQMTFWRQNTPNLMGNHTPLAAEKPHLHVVVRCQNALPSRAAPLLRSSGCPLLHDVHGHPALLAAPTRAPHKPVLALPVAAPAPALLRRPPRRRRACQRGRRFATAIQSPPTGIAAREPCDRRGLRVG